MTDAVATAPKNVEAIGALAEFLKDSTLGDDVKHAIAHAVKKNVFTAKPLPPEAVTNKRTGKLINYPALVEISGGSFKTKRLSPRLLFAVVEHAKTTRDAAQAATELD